MKRKKCFLISAIIIVVFLISSFLYYSIFMCPRISECKELISELQTACNDLDMLKAADCLDPNARSILYLSAKNNVTIEELMNRISGLEDQRMAEDVNQYTDLYREIFGSSFQLSDLIETISITPISYGMPDNPRTVRCRIVTGGVSKYVDLWIWKENGDIYIDFESITLD